MSCSIKESELADYEGAIPSTAETLPGASRGFSLKQNVCVLMINFLVTISLITREEPLLAPGNVSAVEGIVYGSSHIPAEIDPAAILAARQWAGIATPPRILAIDRAAGERRL
jgi:hypothetical protein